MIKSKKCLLEICNNPAFSKGYCKKHCDFKDLKAGNKAIKAKRDKTEEKKAVQSEKREVYFEYHLKRCTHSEETGIAIPNPTKANICHIFAKTNHKSLEDNLENCIHLSLEEHQDFDRLLLGLQFEKLEEKFPKSMLKIRNIGYNLLNLCTENTVFTRALKNYLDGRKSEG